jgi:hypothetical protein
MKIFQIQTYILITFKDDVPFWTSDINSLPEEVKI